MTSPPLFGYTVAVTAERRRTELGDAFARQGAEVRYGQAISIVPLADDTQLREATRRCLAGPLDVVVATTGVGFTGWLDAARSWGLGDDLTAAVGEAAILARGPKVRGAVRSSGLRESWSPASESSAEVLDHLLTRTDLAGRRIAVQLHGDPLSGFLAALRARAAEVIEVAVYRWQPPTDLGPLHRVVEATAAAALDCVTFTSAPAAESFLRSADELGRGAEVRAALRGPVLGAAVGPVTAAPLRAADVEVLLPERPRLGALVRAVVDRLPARAPARGPTR